MYNKLFTSILDSSIWLEPTHIRIVWITLLAAMDKHGYAAFSTVENLAKRAIVTPAQAAAAVQVLTSPDARAPGQVNDGRRIERVDGGFIILNSQKYRDIHDKELQKDANAKRVADWRARQAEKAERATKRGARGTTPAQAAAHHDAGQASYNRIKEAGGTEEQAMNGAAVASGDQKRNGSAANGNAS